MPNLAHLCLRYLAWIVGLRLLYVLAVQQFGLPNTLGTVVILAAVPAADIGMQAVRRASKTLNLADWATIWGVLASVYVVVNVIVPAMLVPQFRLMLAGGAGLRVTVLVTLTTAAMIALFLWIGARSANRRTGR